MTATAVRCLAALVGLAIIGCVAHAAVMASGGYGKSGALLTIGLAAGLVVGSLAIGVAWHEDQRAIAVCLIAALAAGEAWSLLLTAERTIAHRDEHQAPLRAAAEARAKAADRVKLGEAALAAIESTPRLIQAQKAKVAADAAIIDKAAERGCLSNCRQLLQAQADAAAAELAAARADARAKAESRVNQARADLNALPIPPSATPLADRLGIEGWKIDLATAGLASLAANGLGAFLLTFAAHSRRAPHRLIDVTPIADRVEPPSSTRDAAKEADWFARTMFRPKRTGRVKLADVRHAYHEWCRKHGLDPLPDRDIGHALNVLFASVRLYRRGEGPEAAIVGIDWSQPEPLRLEGR